MGITSAQASDITANNAKSVRTDANGAFSAGDLGGNARGSNAINIQTSRITATRVASGTDCVAIGGNSTASGYYGLSTAIGKNSTASGYYGLDTAIGYGATCSGSYGTAIGINSSSTNTAAVAIGYSATASGSTSVSIGMSSNASGYRSSAIGYSATASGGNSTALGYNATASGGNSTAVGLRTKTTVDNTAEIGYWSNTTTRAGAIRVHGTGMVALTVEETNTAYTDGLATAGSEADGTLMRKGMAFRVTTAGNLIVTYCDAAGAITSKDLGAMT